MLIKTFIISFLATWLIGYVVRIISPKIRLMSIPKTRNVHSVPKPLPGGLALFFGFLIGAFFSFRYFQTDNYFEPGDMKRMTFSLLGVLLFMVLMPGQIADLLWP